MAADALAAAAERAGVDYHVETQGSSGAKPLDPAVIAAADAVIFAVDVDVRDKGRFAGKPVVQAPVKRGIDEPDALVAKALAAASDPNAPRVPAGGDGTGATAAVAGGQSFGANLKRWLLTGVSYMIPFVAAGGLIIALAFLIGGYEIGENAGEIVLNNALWNLPPGGLSEYIGSVLIVIGSASMAFLVPALSGYIAYAMADRPGIAPGFVAGSVALVLNAGFLGGLVGGLLAGAAAMWLGRLRPPRWLQGLMPVVIIPLLASLFSSGLLLLILGAPIATLMMWLTDWLNSLTGVSAIALGAILGLMMGFDLGGPVNKVAYAFAVTGLAAGSIENQAPWQIMAAVMAAGMVPPLGMALASTVLARKLFTEPERENGIAAWLLGLSFISEGAIPFAAADPIRVIASSMVGGATAGAICMAAGVTSQAPAWRHLRVLRDRQLRDVPPRDPRRHPGDGIHGGRAEALGASGTRRGRGERLGAGRCRGGRGLTPCARRSRFPHRSRADRPLRRGNLAPPRRHARVRTPEAGARGIRSPRSPNPRKPPYPCSPMNEFWANAIWSLAPTVLIGLIFWFVMRAIIRADRSERKAYARIEAEERAKLARERPAG